MRGGRLGKATTGNKINARKLETFTSQSKETYLEAESVIVTVNTWANMEGASIMVHGKGPDLPMRMAGSFRWEELDAIIVALAAARAS